MSDAPIACYLAENNGTPANLVIAVQPERYDSDVTVTPDTLVEWFNAERIAPIFLYAFEEAVKCGQHRISPVNPNLREPIIGKEHRNFGREEFVEPRLVHAPEGIKKRSGCCVRRARLRGTRSRNERNSKEQRPHLEPFPVSSDPVIPISRCNRFPTFGSTTGQLAVVPIRDARQPTLPPTARPHSQ
jgi:hypothetical protein